MSSKVSRNTNHVELRKNPSKTTSLSSSCGELPSIKAHKSQLPSLAEDTLLLSKPSFHEFDLKFSSKEFSNSVPIFTRAKYDLFGMENVKIDRNFLRKYDDGDKLTDLTKNAQSEDKTNADGQDSKVNAFDRSNVGRGYAAKVRKEKKESTNSSAYVVKISSHQSHMKSDDERKKRLDHALKKQQIKKDGGFLEEKVTSAGSKVRHFGESVAHSNKGEAEVQSPLNMYGLSEIILIHYILG